jgi:hypothetical protein
MNRGAARQWLPMRPMTSITPDTDTRGRLRLDPLELR